MTRRSGAWSSPVPYFAGVKLRIGRIEWGTQESGTWSGSGWCWRRKENSTLHSKVRDVQEMHIAFLVKFVLSNSFSYSAAVCGRVVPAISCTSCARIGESLTYAERMGSLNSCRTSTYPSGRVAVAFFTVLSSADFIATLFLTSYGLNW